MGIFSGIPYTHLNAVVSDTLVFESSFFIIYSRSNTNETINCVKFINNFQRNISHDDNDASFQFADFRLCLFPKEN